MKNGLSSLNKNVNKINEYLFADQEENSNNNSSSRKKNEDKNYHPDQDKRKKALRKIQQQDPVIFDQRKIVKKHNEEFTIAYIIEKFKIIGELKNFFLVENETFLSNFKTVTGKFVNFVCKKKLINTATKFNSQFQDNFRLFCDIDLVNPFLEHLVNSGASSCTLKGYFSALVKIYGALLQMSDFLINRCTLIPKISTMKAIVHNLSKKYAKKYQFQLNLKKTIPGRVL